MAASECTHVTENETRDERTHENNCTNIVDLSSIAEHATPVDVIVKEQIRDVIMLQNATVTHLLHNLSGQESYMRDHLVSREEHVSKLKEVEQSLVDAHVTREEYDALSEKLQQEQCDHANTKVRLMEVTDKLAFTEGEVDVLSKQLAKEKDAFQQIVDSLRSQVAKGNNWNEELDGKYSACQRQVQDLTARLASREATIATLEQRLSSQQRQCERRMEEMEVERQQNHYVSRMMDQPKGRGKNSSISNKAKR